MGRDDVVVCGGGVAGIAAAIRAARQGARTLLIERAGALARTATTGLMSLIVIPFDLPHGFPRECFTRLREGRGGAWTDAIPWDAEGYKLLTAEMCEAAGIDVLLYTMLWGALVENGAVRGVIVENESGRQAGLAKTVIDAMGDADVLARAGEAFVVGREKDRAMRPVTVMGRLANVGLRRLQRRVEEHPEDFGKDDNRQLLDPAAGMVRIDGSYSIVRRAPPPP